MVNIYADNIARFQCDKKLRALVVVENNITVEFEDGTRETGSMIIGCDGSHSKVREFLVGYDAAKLEDTGHTLSNYAASNYTPDQARLLRSYHPIVKLGWHPTVPGGALLAGTDPTMLVALVRLQRILHS